MTKNKKTAGINKVETPQNEQNEITVIETYSPEQLGNYVSVSTVEEKTEVEKIFSPEFFTDPKIIDLREKFGINTVEKYQFGIFAGNNLVNMPEEENPKVFSNRIMFIETERKLKSLIPSLYVSGSSLKDSYSGEVKFSFPTKQKEVRKGDILNAAIIMKNSYTGSLKPGISFAFDRVWCANGARRKEIVEFKTLDEAILKNAELLISMMENEFTIESQKIDLLQDKIIPHSLVEKTITPAIEAMGFHKKFSSQAHQTMFKEAEDFQTPLNAFLVYNGFNKILFNRQDTSMNINKKENLDAEIFDYLLNTDFSQN